MDFTRIMTATNENTLLMLGVNALYVIIQITNLDTEVAY